MLKMIGSNPYKMTHKYTVEKAVNPSCLAIQSKENNAS